MNIGIIGYGYWGPNLVRNFSRVEDCTVKTCADLDPKRREAMREKYPYVKATAYYKEILGDPEILGVVIATPVETHFSLAKEALERGKHVLIEKPITRTSEEARELVGIAKKMGLVLMVDHTFEYSPAINKIKEIIKSSELGKIFTIDMIRVNLGLFQKKVNVVWDLAPHDISILHYLLEDMPEKAWGIGDAHVQDGIEDDAHVSLLFKSNIRANLHVSWLDPCKIRRITIVGNKKMLVFDDTLKEGKITIYDKGVTIEKNRIPMQPYYTTLEEWELVYRSGESYSPEINDKEPLLMMAEHFVECVQKNRSPVSDGVSGWRVIKVMEAVQESLKNSGKEVGVR